VCERRSWSPAVRGSRGAWSCDAGSAAVEFASIGMLLMIPLVYLVMTLGRIQAGSLAAQSGARSAARVMTTAGSSAQGSARAQVAADLALADQGFDSADGTLSLDCADQPCLTPGAQVRAQVDVQVGLPLVPAFLSEVIPLSVTVTASQLAVVDDFRAAAR
jgi:Flp pilus assembly protein TadG